MSEALNGRKLKTEDRETEEDDEPARSGEGDKDDPHGDDHHTRDGDEDLIGNLEPGVPILHPLSIALVASVGVARQRGGSGGVLHGEAISGKLCGGIHRLRTAGEKK